MTLLSGTWAIAIANLLTPLAVVVFSSGFFPYKPVIPGLAKFDSNDSITTVPKAFDKVIFMVVDALRSDFVYSNNSGFSFTQSLIRSGAALPFTAYASSPTVTMPRLKAMTTGSIPSFLDVILNIAESDTSSTLLYQDTWLTQLKTRGDQLIMYGDDTWLKLFPGMFKREDGTNSFFVSDFSEVDNNVTRHVSNELLRDDWSAFIMHYLGLDHIGHKAGPQSPYMAEKHREMDSVVSQIYTSMEKEKHLESTLFVLCGDHGMNDAGNHGGSSLGETSPALVFMSPKFQALGTFRESPMDPLNDFQYYRTVEQTDITPTLAGLLGFPIPLNSYGVFIPELLGVWNTNLQKVHILLANSKQLLRTVKEAFPGHNFDPDLNSIHCEVEPLLNIEEAQCSWLRVLRLLHDSGGIDNDDLYAELESALLQFSRISQKLMSSAASNYNIGNLVLGLGLIVLVTALSFPTAYNLLSTSGHVEAFFMLSILIYGGMMFASSYVEEEQQFWNWIFTAWVFYLHIKSATRSHCSISRQHRMSKRRRSYVPLLARYGGVALLVSHRVLRRWNQTGQKFAAEPDIARTFLPSHRLVLWFLVVLTYTGTCMRLTDRYLSRMWRLCCLVVTTSALLLKVAFVAADSPELFYESLLTPLRGILNGRMLIIFTRLVMGGILSLVPLSVYIARKSGTRPFKEEGTVFHEALTLFLITQSRVTNIPIFLIFRLHAKIIAPMRLSVLELTVTSLLAQYMTFFAFGGSNAISSVDLSNAYNGIGNYSIILVGILTFVSNWSGPIWWVSAARVLRSKQARHERKAYLAIITLHMATSTMSVMAACTALRTHLFIWTVFSPKYLYAIAWAIVNHLTVNLLGETLGETLFS
ncbi:alkaline phosphatase-like protein [Aspergillus heteromorphus CBS 117.55]|uniref:GPI ethanolamine phosphate transferase 2 n=1 Tax=Aspergillus heteromorphus CBS 117.55 TaxID=1448321 RepID=A0A317UQL3_9EURO|nr:alkaline phosphatase-like protein [Aspergillus heteromorphus CBS 117.55]PWY64294.1 alkaline phosphatase-like protein [Aspergillus heteromorphus CBS 117.55]